MIFAFILFSFLIWGAHKQQQQQQQQHKLYLQDYNYLVTVLQKL